MIARTILLTAVLLIFSSDSRAAEPPKDAIGLILDMQLTKDAHLALRQDKELAAYRLEVEVKGQVARLRGMVPNRELGDFACDRLKLAVPRLKSVQSDLTYSGAIVLKIPSSDTPSSSSAPPILIEDRPAPRTEVPHRPATPLATPASRDLLTARVEAIQKNSAFARVRVEIRGRLLIVYRGTQADAASVLAQRLRDIPDIDGVELLD